ncbi:siderophore-interacting protein [Glycomyces sp. A-F 0318]|uniref:siderophore-interacting protein n=1 Tax=Glycomyces amatae TaxID=2881355 RepID=UPI001E495D43|nr:siderophore-interacting protein [Glycomyces amatae]MCD0444017.1 siderophore-interacting protein [Glycomyces amatae]
MARRHLVVHPLVLRRAQVLRVDDLNPRTRRVTLTGEQLGPFERDGLRLPAFRTEAFDDHVKLVFAADGDLAPVLPVQLEDGIDWPPSETRRARDYTPRRFDPEALELDLEFVLHGDGPAAAWAAAAAPGDDLWFAGPKSSAVVPADADWVLLAGDETALPAIARYLDERPVDAPVRVVAAVPDEAAYRDLPTRPGDRVAWVKATPGDPRALADAVRGLDAPPGEPYVWAAAESRSLLPLRRRVSRELRLPKSRSSITGYWHREDAEAAAPAASLQAPTAWFAVRAALRLGLLDSLGAGPVPLPALAEQLGIDGRRLATLLEVLATAGVAAGPDPAALGPAGEELLADEHARERFTGVDADRVLALAELAGALELDEPAWSRVHGRTMRQSLERDRHRYEELVEDAEGLAHLVNGLPRLPVWGSGAMVAVTGPGAVVLADLLRERLDIDPSIVESPVPLEVLRQESERFPHRFSEQWRSTGVAATALALGHRTDDEAVALLTEMRRAATKAVLVEALRPDALGPGAAHEALLGLAATGSAPRSPSDIAVLAADAGWTVADRRPLGWGVEYFALDGAVQ